MTDGLLLYEFTKNLLIWGYFMGSSSVRNRYPNGYYFLFPSIAYNYEPGYTLHRKIENRGNSSIPAERQFHEGKNRIRAIGNGRTDKREEIRQN
jgi:hypothetical protein